MAEYNVLSEMGAKVESIKGELELFIATCLAENEEESESIAKVKAKYNAATLDYRVRVKLAEILRQTRTIPDQNALQYTADDLHNIYYNYLTLISWVNNSISYAPNKVEFLSFAGISVRAFQNMLENGKPDVQQECADIDNDLLNLTLSAAERGQIKEATGKLRLKGKGGVGHSFVEIGDAESVLDKMTDTMSKEQYRYELDQAKVLKSLIDGQKRKG